MKHLDYVVTYCFACRSGLEASPSPPLRPFFIEVVVGTVTKHEVLLVSNTVKVRMGDRQRVVSVCQDVTHMSNTLKRS